TQSGAERIANDAAQAGVGAAVRLDRGRMIVRLHLEANVMALVKAHHAGIVLEDADAPVVLAQPAADFLCGAEDSLLQQIIDPPPVEVDPALQRLVRAMLRPG